MPDSSYVIKADTRRELKSAIQYEADSYADAGFIGNQKRRVASIAAASWKNKSASLPYCLPFAPSHARTNYCHGVFVSRASRSEYLEYLEAEGC
jgi:hypothetical protein